MIPIQPSEGGYRYHQSFRTGGALLYSNGKQMLKIAGDEYTLLHEYDNIIRQIQAKAGKYLPMPISLRSMNGHPVLQMANPGPTIAEIADSMTKCEIILCLLQAIHFLVLCWNEIEVEGVHPETLCARYRDSFIELRFTDFSRWHTSIQLAEQGKSKDQILAHNVWMLLQFPWDFILDRPDCIELWRTLNTHLPKPKPNAITMRNNFTFHDESRLIMKSDLLSLALHLIRDLDCRNDAHWERVQGLYLNIHKACMPVETS